MNLERLHVKNWKSFTDKEFLFKHGVNLIEGDNYSGKTSFVQALYFALFNETLYPDYLTAKELRKEGEKGAMTTTESISVPSAESQYHLPLRGFWGSIENRG